MTKKKVIKKKKEECRNLKLDLFASTHCDFLNSNLNTKFTH